MQASFFDALELKEKRATQEAVATLVNLLGECAQQYPFIRTVRIPAVALLVATIAPRLDSLDMALLGKLVLWIFGIDDAIDEGVIALADLRRKFIKQWYAAANSGLLEHGEGNELARLLSGIRGELSEYRAFTSLCGDWSANVRLIAQAMARECQYTLRYRAGGAGSLPSIHEYIQNGTHSIGVPLWMSTLLITLNAPLVEEQSALADEAIKCSAAAVRLYNDFQTLDKEIRDGKVNSIIIKYHAILDQNPNMAQEAALLQARLHTLQMADSYTQRCDDLARHIQTEGGKFEDSIRRMAPFHGSFYREHDFHTTTTAKIDDLLQVPKGANASASIENA